MRLGLWMMLAAGLGMVMAAGCGGEAPRSRSKSSRWKRLQKEAEEYCRKGDENLRTALRRKEEKGQRAADPYFRDAREYFQRALGIYEELNRRFPGKFRPMIKEIQDRLYTINKESGFSG